MSDKRIQNLANLLVNYCVEVQPNETVLIRGGVAGLPLLRETYRAALEAGGLPTVMAQDETLTEILLSEGNDAQLSHIPKPVEVALETYDCAIGIRAAENTRTLSNIDPQKQATMRQAQSSLMAKQMQRSAEGNLRWVATLFPTNAYAQDADLSLSDYEDFVYSATFANRDDPVAAWREISDMQQRLVDWLKGKKAVRVKGPNADLTLSIAGRTFINSDGKRNMPSGEIFTGPVEDSVNGWVRFTYPAIYSGREVDGIELTFKDGKVVEASAKKNEEFLLSVLDTDEGARYLGEFAVGTNNGIDRFTKQILFDEKIGGTIHMAVGRGYPETGSKNVSAVHWDLICDMRDGGQIWIDDELFYESGNFLV